MNNERPPTIDPQAAARWEQVLSLQSPWLHEEVARRMESRLGWILRGPQSWVNWAPLRGGRQVHAALVERYDQATCHIHEPVQAHRQTAREVFGKSRWSPARWLGLGGAAATPHFDLPRDPVDMVWANMALHMHADPQALIQQWHQLLKVDGFLMFSCLGPDTLREMRSMYAQAGWPACGHEFTDMHDWGDMLVHAGFAEPVMDMERITLTFGSPDTLLAELRGLGRNLHGQRFAALRGRKWLGRLKDQITRQLASPNEPGRYQLTFEIIYGHAFKPVPRAPVSAQTNISLQDMRSVLAKGRKAS